MEDAIKTVVTTFLKSANGKDNLDSKGFQKLVSKQLSGMMEVRSGIFALYNRCAFFDTTLYFLNIKINKKIAVFFFLTISAHTLSSVCIRLPQDTDNCAAIKEMQQGLDENNDGKVSFQEFLSLLGYLAKSLSNKQHPQNAGAEQEAS